ncbi:pseudouridine synthase [Hymenobacter sp. BT175]|uniref:pseudouridine synthase n=1 Tax=Hymenobacter translucens TaxID=2886507 RepID=UPI001D0E6D4A|nr:pseudouridine synthase [Hymenobacter translucens]MCC2548098.1 pseudouridine synthase [Hymenobacter translucens]
MRYVLVNKPFEVLTQFTDENGRATLKDFVAVPKIYPVGRLDYDSEGLVLLTDDKPLQHRLSEPRYKVPKTYWVQVEGEPTEEALAQLRRGVDIKTSFTAPAEARLLPEPPAIWERAKPIRFRANIPTSWLEITISQGMNRQVRKMTAAVGFPTLRLVRVQIAFLRIDGLAPGQWRDLTSEEAAKLKAAYSSSKMPDQRSVTPKAAAGPKPGAKFTGSRPAAGKPDTARPTADKPAGGKPAAARAASSARANGAGPSRPAGGAAAPRGGAGRKPGAGGRPGSGSRSGGRS